MGRFIRKEACDTGEKGKALPYPMKSSEKRVSANLPVPVRKLKLSFFMPRQHFCSLPKRIIVCTELLFRGKCIERMSVKNDCIMIRQPIPKFVSLNISTKNIDNKQHFIYIYNKVPRKRYEKNFLKEDTK